MLSPGDLLVRKAPDDDPQDTWWGITVHCRTVLVIHVDRGATWPEAVRPASVTLLVTGPKVVTWDFNFLMHHYERVSARG